MLKKTTNASQEPFGVLSSSAQLIAVSRERPDMNRPNRGALIGEEATFDIAHYAVIATDAEGTITDWNKGAERLFGYTADEVIGLNASICYERNLEALERELVAPLKRDARIEFVGKMVNKAGEVFDGHTLGLLITGPDGEITGMVGYMLDITERKRADDVYRRYEQIISVSPDMMSFVGPDYRYSAVNDAYVNMLGRQKEEIIGHQVWEFTGQEKFDKLVKPKLDASLTGISGRLEGWFDYPGRGQRFMDIVYEPVRDDNDAVIGVAVSIRDITDRHRAENKLKTQTKLLNRAEMSAQVGHFHRKFSDGTVYLSDELYRILGVDKKTFDPTRESVFEHLHPEDLERYVEATDAAAARGDCYKIDIRGIRSDGEIRYLHIDGETEISDTGEPVANFGVVKDITENRKTEAELFQRGVQLDTITRLSTTGIFRTDRSGQATFVNERWSEIMELAAGSDPALGWTASIHPDDRDFTVSNWENCVAKGIPYACEFRIIRPDGSVTWTCSEAAPERDLNGEIIGYVGFILDITEQILAETELKESDARHRDLYENAPFAYVSNNPDDGSFMNCNKAFRDLLGYSYDEITCMNIRQILPETAGGRLKAKAIVGQIDRGEPIENAELQLKRKNGKIIWVNMSVTDRKDATGKMVERRSTIVDITDRKLAEEALKESEAQLNTVTRFSPVAMVQTDRDGFVTFVNEAFLQIHGREQEEMLRDAWADAIHPEDLGRVEEEWRFCTENDGTFINEYRIVQPGGRIVWVFGQTVPVRDQNGDIVGHVGTLTDITEIKRDEER